MYQVNTVRNWRALLIAGGLALLGASQAVAAPMMPFRAAELMARAEPFERSAMTLPGGNPLSEKWQGVEREIENELLVLALCEEDRARCTAPAAKFLDIIVAGKARDGRARLGEINRAINLAVRQASDVAIYGASDVWRTPLGMLATGAGDCEDYAIAKLVALRAAGIGREDLRLVILRDNLRQEDHAVTSVRLDGRWWLLDNRKMAMVEDISLLNHRPLFVLDDNGVRMYRDAPLMAGTRHRSVEPAELLKLALRVK